MFGLVSSQENSHFHTVGMRNFIVVVQHHSKKERKNIQPERNFGCDLNIMKHFRCTPAKAVIVTHATKYHSDKKFVL